jgi:hypothetical protein
MMTDHDYTEKQGQYLAFIYNYTVMHGQPPAQADLQRFFRVSPPTIHQMVLRLHDLGLIAREPGMPRAIHVLVPPDQLPWLREPSSAGRAKRRTMPSEAEVYQIKVTLEDSKPPIWRRLLVRSDITLGDLHPIIQVAMGWCDCHLHQFIVQGTYFGEPHPEYDLDLDMRDEQQVTLRQIDPGEGFTFQYEYDFGDGWEHQVLVEKILPPGPGQRYPLCIEGRRACPPEDVGGTWGYLGFLEAIQDPDHPEHEEYLEWVGDEFDPEAFDLDAVNEALRELG